MNFKNFRRVVRYAAELEFVFARSETIFSISNNATFFDGPCDQFSTITGKKFHMALCKHGRATDPAGAVYYIWIDMETTA
jgi:hypothetical protein